MTPEMRDAMPGIERFQRRIDHIHWQQENLPGWLYRIIRWWRTH